MELLTKELRRKLPPLGAQDGKGDDAVAFVKYFDPCGSWTWWATEANALLTDGREVPLKDAPETGVEDIIFFGLVNGFEVELGEFSLNELKSVKGPLGLGIERDLYYTPTKLGDIRKKIGRN